jgi:hypothetical protein
MIPGIWKRIPLVTLKLGITSSYVCEWQRLRGKKTSFIYTRRAADFQGYSDPKSRRYLSWLVFGSSTYYLYAFVASILSALISSLI